MDVLCCTPAYVLRSTSLTPAAAPRPQSCPPPRIPSQSPHLAGMRNRPLNRHTHGGSPASTVHLDMLKGLTGHIVTSNRHRIDTGHILLSCRGRRRTLPQEHGLARLGQEAGDERVGCAMAQEEARVQVRCGHLHNVHLHWTGDQGHRLSETTCTPLDAVSCMAGAKRGPGASDEQASHLPC